MSKQDPDHYKVHPMECWDEMEAVFPEEMVKSYYALCAWKYRYRAGSKVGESAEEDKGKADTYIKRAATYRERHQR